MTHRKCNEEKNNPMEMRPAINNPSLLPYSVNTEYSSPSSFSESRKERPISMGLFQLPGSDLTPDPQRETVETPSEPWRYNDLSHPHSNTSLKVTIYFPPVNRFSPVPTLFYHAATVLDRLFTNSLCEDKVYSVV